MGVEAADREAQLRKHGEHAAHEGLGRAEVRRLGAQMVDAYLEGGGLVALEVDHFAAVGLKGGAQPQVDGGGQDAAVLVVCMVAGKLNPAGRKNGFEHGILLCRFSLQTPLAYTTRP